MPTPAQAIPPGFHTITPYLVVKEAEKAIEFYRRAFDAEEVSRSCCGRRVAS